MDPRQPGFSQDHLAVLDGIESELAPVGVLEILRSGSLSTP